MRRLLVLLIFSLGLLPTKAVDRYINPAAVSSGNGTDWNQAYTGFSAINQANLNPGDTIWMAAGPYGSINVVRSGAPGNFISFVRATVANHGTATGWNPAFDGQAFANVPYATGNTMFRIDGQNYIKINGQVTNGILINLPIPTIDTSKAQAALVMGIYSVGNSNIFQYIECSGPASVPNNDIGIFTGNSDPSRHSTNLWINHVFVHGCTGSIQPTDTDYCLIDNNELCFTPGNFFNHDNCAYVGAICRHGIFRNNYIHDWGAIAVTFNAQGPPGPDDWDIYGNVFVNHNNGQSLQTDASGPNFWEMGPNWRIYNNTFANVAYSFRNDSRFVGHTSSTTGGSYLNNLMWSSGSFTPGAMTHNFNFTDASTLFGEPNGIINAPFSPFINLPAWDLNIVAAIDATHPRNKGNNVGSFYSPDPNGTSRVGKWSIGAFEYGVPSSDPGTVNFPNATASIAENGGSLIVTINRASGPNGAISVTASTADGTAHAGHDYTSTIATLNWVDTALGARSFSIPIINSGDTALTNRTFTVSLSGATGGATIIAPSTLTVTIIMTAPVPPPVPGNLQFSSAVASISETGGSLSVTVNRINGSDGAASVTATTSDGTAHAGHDYTFTTQVLNWGANQSGSRSFAVPILNSGDTATTNRTFTITLSGVSGATLIIPFVQTVTIVMNPPPLPPVVPGNVSFLVSTATISETGGNLSVTVIRTGGSDGASTVTATTSDGTAHAGHDYVSVTQVLNWADLQSGSRSFLVPILNSGDTSTANRTFLITLSGAINSPLTAPTVQTVTIVMNPPPPAIYGQIGWTQTAYQVNETAGTITLSVTRSAATNAVSTVAYFTSDGTAVAGFDYITTTGSFTWGLNENSTKSFTVPIIDSGSFGPSRSFFVGLQNTAGASLLAPQRAQISITMTVPITVTSKVTIGKTTFEGSVTLGGQ